MRWGRDVWSEGTQQRDFVDRLVASRVYRYFPFMSMDIVTATSREVAKPQTGLTVTSLLLSGIVSVMEGQT